MIKPSQVILVVSILCMASIAQARGIVDQSFEEDFFASIAFGAYANQRILAQSFTPSKEVLVGLDLAMGGSSGDGPGSVRISIHAGAIDAPEMTYIIGSVEYVTDWHHFDLRSPIALTPGATYFIKVTAEPGTTAYWYNYYAPGEPLYQEGAAWWCDSYQAPNCEELADADFGFRTYVIPRQSKDPCTQGSNAAIERARDYQKAARDVPSVCADIAGDCDLAEVNADLALLELTNAHQVMVNACGPNIPPPPPAESPTLFGDLVINEVMADPAQIAEYAGEWLEIHNPTQTNFDLLGLTVVIGITGSSIFDIDTSAVVPAGGYIVIGKTMDGLQTDGAQVDVVADFNLLDHDLYISITNGTSVLDEIDLRFTATPNGASLQLDRNFADATSNDDTSHWCPAQFLYGIYNNGSPGGVNDSCN